MHVTCVGAVPSTVPEMYVPKGALPYRTEHTVKVKYQYGTVGTPTCTPPSPSIGILDSIPPPVEHLTKFNLVRYM